MPEMAARAIPAKNKVQDPRNRRLHVRTDLLGIYLTHDQWRLWIEMRDRAIWLTRTSVGMRRFTP